MSENSAGTAESKAGLLLLVFLSSLLLAVVLAGHEKDETEQVRSESKERISDWHKERSAPSADARTVWPDVVRMDGRRKRVRKVDFDPAKGLSESCVELNRVVVTGMHALHKSGAPPPFPVSPLMEVLRSGDCDPSEPSVRVLMIWLKAAAEAQGIPWSGISSHNNSGSP